MYIKVVNERIQTISIHALREEGDTPSELKRTDGGIFLSTPSARRATSPLRSQRVNLNISIHALREEGDIMAQRFIKLTGKISIHALREEGDLTLHN